ncbi:MAG: GH36-type glycosyl hydrolase domain-containing protein [Steroidobacter sp.]
MTSPTDTRVMRLDAASGLTAEFNANGSIRRMDHGEIAVNLFVGNELEGGPANLWLRLRTGQTHLCVPLLGPRSPTRFQQHSDATLTGAGEMDGLRYSLVFALSAHAPAWFWHVSIENTGDSREIDVISAQDLALAPYGVVRLNEYYVSQYIDHTPLVHAARGGVIASRQNLAVQGRHPWCVMGSLRNAASFATDAMQVHGLATRAGETPIGIANGLPARRLQHEHSMVAIQDAPVRLERGERIALGFFGYLVANHPAATSVADLSRVDDALALAEATPPAVDWSPTASSAAATLFSNAPLLNAIDLSETEIITQFGAAHRHAERDEQGSLLSFFCGEDGHVVLRAKELRVQRPHGHLLRTGRRATPDEAALTSTTWMSGVFHSMLTQGHVSINRFLSTIRSYLGLFRSHGQRVFAEIDGEWRLFDTPSAFEMTPAACRWIYRHAAGALEVRSEAHTDPHEFSLRIEVLSGPRMRFLISHHIALNGDDGSLDGAAVWRREGDNVSVSPSPSSDLYRRFPQGSFLLEPDSDTLFERVGGDELLFLDGCSRQQSYICVITAPTSAAGLRIQGRLLPSVSVATGPSSRSHLQITPPPDSPHADSVRQLVDIAPWFTHNALIHYLAPRGLEQYSGGGWGTRDVCQGPVELLLSSGDTAPVRDLLLRVMSAQNPDGDWPQWFMFFERDRDIRAGDSHGDVVFWPILALAQYLIASGDATLLEERTPFFDARGEDLAEHDTVWGHVERALHVIEGRVIGGAALPAYGHGDWNDSLQPADPAMRDHMCSAWTATLHRQTLVTLARAMRAIGRDGEALRFETQAGAVESDFQRLLVIDGVLAGYALFDAGAPRYLLHPRDEMSGVRYSSLAMIHAILENMFTPEQARTHLRLIDERLSGPDGVRLFDRPMPYRGGPQRMFQRAESATFFGREIGLMYMHAHLRYAQALAHVGDAGGFFRALCQANPIGLRNLVPEASLRQANCYYSSSDAAFADRYEASAGYERVARGEIALDGGWRVYSSGAGIAMSLIARRFLGVSQEHEALVIDPVMPAALSSLTASLTVYNRPIEIHYDVQGDGCGVSRVDVNGVRPPLDFEENPYRKGAARIAKSALIAALNDTHNIMRVSVG